MDNKMIEYKELMETYRIYISLYLRAVMIYLVIIGACLTLPYTITIDPNRAELFREMCRFFGIIITVFSVSGSLVASYVFFKLHIRLSQLSRDFNFNIHKTWLLPFVVWLASGSATILLILVIEYT